MCLSDASRVLLTQLRAFARHRRLRRIYNKKHLENVGPIHHCEPPHAHSADVASGTVARRLRIDVDDVNDNDNA